MFLTLAGSVQRPLTSGPRGWPANQIPWLASQVLCWFGPRLRAHVSTQKGEGQGGEEIRWRPNHMAGQPPLSSYQLNQVGNPSLDPYKYPSTCGNQNTHHILEISLAKLPFLVL
jgi:hypothetical protein